MLASLPPHPHIVQYYTSWTEQGSHGEFLYHQLEKCDISLGSLVALGESRLREAEMLEVLRQVCYDIRRRQSASGSCRLHRDTASMQQSKWSLQARSCFGSFRYCTLHAVAA